MPTKGKRSSRSKAPAADTEQPQEPKIDEVLAKLEGVVEALEGGELPLEQALTQFEHGVRLARQGSGMLDSIEQRVEVLLSHKDAADEGARAPFESAREDDDVDL